MANFISKLFLLTVLSAFCLSVFFNSPPVWGNSSSRIKKQWLLKKVEAALGGSKNIQKIQTLSFYWNAAAAEAGESGSVSENSQELGKGEEWLTIEGNDHIHGSSAYSGGSTVEVLSNGRQSLKVPVLVSALTQTLPSSGENCSTGQNPLCVSPLSLDFNPSFRNAVMHVYAKNFTETIIEKDNCHGIASVSPSSGKGPQVFFKVKTDHPGRCFITFSIDSPAGWLLNGDQGAVGTSSGSTSTGQISGPDLSREISRVYWKTFSYLTAVGLRGKVDDTVKIKASHYILKMFPDGGDPIKAFISRTTFLPVKIQLGNDSDPTREVIKFSQWKWIKGVRFPFKTLTYSVDQFSGIPRVERFVFKKIQINAAIPKGAFKKPQPAL